MAVVGAEGVTTPFDEDEISYSAFGTRTPALRSFYLAYDIGDATPGDHEILNLGLLAGGSAQDLSPDAASSPANVPDGQLKVYLQDAAAEEEFYYKVSHSTLRLPGARRYQIRQLGNVGEVTRKLPTQIFPQPSHAVLGDPVLALVGFRLFFQGREHELDRVGIWFRGDDLHVVLRDESAAPAGDNYSFLVDFVVIPAVPGVEIQRGVETGTVAGGARVSVPTTPRSHVLLTGWMFNFRNGDHKIRELGIDRQGQEFVVFYADKNADDTFDWRVEWATLTPQLVAPVSGGS